MKKLITSTMALVCVVAFSLETQARKSFKGDVKSKTTTGKAEAKTNKSNAQSVNTSKTSIKAKRDSAINWASHIARTSQSQLSAKLQEIIQLNPTLRAQKSDFAVDAGQVTKMIRAVNSVGKNYPLSKPEVQAKALETALVKEGFTRKQIEDLKTCKI